MNYDQLRALSWEQLMELLERTAKAHRNDTDLLKSEPNLQRAQVAPPTLCLLGDFEIRARFYEQRSEVGDQKSDEPSAPA